MDKCHTSAEGGREGEGGGRERGGRREGREEGGGEGGWGRGARGEGEVRLGEGREERKEIKQSGGVYIELCMYDSLSVTNPDQQFTIFYSTTCINLQQVLHR